ncbi:hypothetical protein LZ31DRAFT_209782 [Colletotrichum somersetense]|nr:hypothetical protein LZ31DRAFT_209782 [Colletotrichum somersetense]
MTRRPALLEIPKICTSYMFLCIASLCGKNTWHVTRKSCESQAIRQQGRSNVLRLGPNTARLGLSIATQTNVLCCSGALARQPAREMAAARALRPATTFSPLGHFSLSHVRAADGPEFLSTQPASLQTRPKNSVAAAATPAVSPAGICSLADMTSA